MHTHYQSFAKQIAICLGILAAGEIGYNLPSKICQKATLQAVRFYFTGMNLLTFDNRRFKDFDVEAINAASYPIYRTYNIGVNITF